MYKNGWGVPQNYAWAVKWYQKAAEQGQVNAQYNLGFMYNNGVGMPQDYAKAKKWYRKAAEQGEAISQFNLGFMYHQGHGAPQDYIQAHMWYNLSAAQSITNAAKNRDLIAKDMTPAQIAEAQKLAQEWKPKW